MLQTLVKIYDDALKEVEAKEKRAAQELGRATSSAGYKLQQLIKSGMQAEAPEGEKWPPASPWTRLKVMAKAQRSFARAKAKGKAAKKVRRIGIGGKGKKALSRLAGAVRFVKEGSGEQTTVRVGFVSPSAAKLAAYHAEPHTVAVTPKMRRLIFAAGLIITKPTLNIPARPHVEVIWKKRKDTIAPFVDRRVRAALEGKAPDSINLE